MKLHFPVSCLTSTTFAVKLPPKPKPTDPSSLKHQVTEQQFPKHFLDGSLPVLVLRRARQSHGHKPYFIWRLQRKERGRRKTKWICFIDNHTFGAAACSALHCIQVPSRLAVASCPRQRAEPATRCLLHAHTGARGVCVWQGMEWSCRHYIS